MTAFFPCRSLASLALAGAGLLSTQTSLAADFSLSGNATFHNDVVQIDFTVDALSDVRVWTDSWLSGVNFDPYLALFNSSGTLIASNDDADAPFGAGPGFFDAGLVLPALAGHYRLTVTAAPNSPNGPQLRDGFALDAESPITIGDWNQPSHDLNANDQKGTFWRVQLQGVDQAGVVPEPTAFVLMLAGLLGLGTAARRRHRSGGA